MRIAVHAKVLSETDLTGIGIYVRESLRALARIDSVNQYVLYSNEPFRHRIEAPNFSHRVLRFPRFWSYLRLPFEFVGGRFDVLFVTKEQLPLCFRPPTVLVVYDLVGLLFPERMALAPRVHFQIAVRYALPRADALIAISEATKQHVVAACSIEPDRIRVAYPGFDRSTFRPDIEPARIAAVRDRLQIGGEYFLNTSSVIWHRKNLVRTLQAFATLRDERRGATPRLVITGKRGEGWDELLAWRQRLGLEEHVMLAGFVPPEEIPALLAGALALVFPSLDEGFGLPLVEAMACGCPVLSSNVSAIPEVVGDAGLLVDPTDTEALALALGRLCDDRALRHDLRRRGFERAERFSWEATARATRAVLEEVARKAR